MAGRNKGTFTEDMDSFKECLSVLDNSMKKYILDNLNIKTNISLYVYRITIILSAANKNRCCS